MNKIPNVIYQTWYTNDLPEFISTRIKNMLKLNPSYEYKFFNDDDMDDFVLNNFNAEIVNCYMKLNIRAARADFWRYLILYKYGGVYLDIDCLITESLELFIKNDDAILSIETIGTSDCVDKKYYINWAMIFSKKHPILKKTIDFLINNINNNTYPNNIYKTTGPAVLSRAINYIHLKTYNEIINLEKINCDYDYSFYCNGYSYRIYGIKYNKKIIHKFPGYEILYKNKEHWTKQQEKIDLIL